MSDIDENAVGRFTDPIGVLISRNAQGEITYPTDPVQLQRALRIERAWATYYANGDDSLLVEVGLFPEGGVGGVEGTSEQANESV